MRREHLPLLACPDCHGPLVLRPTASGDGDRVLAGSLTCAACACEYPIVRGVPRFVSSANYAQGFGFQWARHPRLQFDSCSGVSASTERFFRQTGWPRDLIGEAILEIGCGAGRFTETAAATGATVVSLDYSEAADVNHTNHGHLPNVLVAQADIYRLPVPRAAFDRLFCFGVLQHTPDPERAFLALPSCLKPGGSLAVDVYRKFNGLRRLADTKYWARPLTRRIPHRALYRLVSAYIRCAWPFASRIGRIPRVGTRINWKLLIADQRESVDLPEHVLRDWAILDTFDMLAPAYDYPQSERDVHRWCSAANLHEARIAVENALVVARARTPATAAVS